MPRLANKTALITGGTSGIGLATAHRFIQEGARVIVTGTSLQRRRAAEASLGSSAEVVEADAGDIAAQVELAQVVKRRLGKLDVLFINAAVAEFKPMSDWTEQDFDRSFAVNVKGPYFLVQALLPIFSDGASIILNGSINARIGMPRSSVYAATKAALISFIRTWSGETIDHGIRVNAISPGPIDTPLHSSKSREGLVSQIPVGRFGYADEIAAAAVYLASDEARFTVGAEFVVDGGMSAL